MLSAYGSCVAGAVPAGVGRCRRVMRSVGQHDVESPHGKYENRRSPSINHHSTRILNVILQP